jgi:ComF family protein
VERLVDLPLPPARGQPYGAVRAAFTYGGPVRQAVWRGKYRGDRRALSALAAVGAERLGPALLATGIPSAIVAVPLGARRRRVRGYNQAEVVARQLARLVPSVPLLAGLSRVRETPPQVGRGAEQRRRNLAGAFAWTGPALGGTVWLVDDVVTTGATFAAAAAALQRAGAVRIEAVAAGFAPAGPPTEWPHIVAGG